MLKLRRTVNEFKAYELTPQLIEITSKVRGLTAATYLGANWERHQKESSAVEQNYQLQKAAAGLARELQRITACIAKPRKLDKIVLTEVAPTNEPDCVSLISFPAAS